MTHMLPEDIEQISAVPLDLICTSQGFFLMQEWKVSISPNQDTPDTVPGATPVSVTSTQPSPTLWVTRNTWKHPLHGDIGCYSGLGTYWGLGVMYKGRSHICLSRWILWIHYKEWEPSAILLSAVFTVLKFYSMINETNIYTNLIAGNVLVINIDLKSSLTELNGLVGERSLNKQFTEVYWVLPSASWKHLSNPRQVQVRMVTPIAGTETADTLNDPW